jgi:predicted transposase YdaD
MAGSAGPRDVHDRLIKHVLSRKEALAAELRRVLPPRLLAHLDLRTLDRRSTERTDERLRGRTSDLHFTVDFVDGGNGLPVHLPIEHQSTFDGNLPLRTLVCACDIWHEHLRDHPDATSLPLVLPILLVQHPARNTPSRLSMVLDVPPGVREAFPSPIEPIEVVSYVDDLSGSVLDDTEAEPATLALLELARAFLHAYKNPTALTEARMATLAPLFDVLLKQREPLASNDVRALLTYVFHAFEAGSPIRDLIERTIQGRPREMYTTIADALVAEGEEKGRAEGEEKGRAAGLARAVLGVLEHRAVSIPEPLRERVSSARNEHQLQRWFDRAFTAVSAEDIFDALDD